MKSITLTERLSLFFDQLRIANVSRLARYGHGGFGPDGWSPMQWGCAIAGEVGELCEAIGTYETSGRNEYRALMGAEAADVLIYLDLLGGYFEIPLTIVEIGRENHSSLYKYACEIATEAGLLCNTVKKYERRLAGDPSLAVLRGAVIVRLSLLTSVLFRFSGRIGINMPREVAAKFNASSAALGHPERLVISEE
jgi:NTP pyrophosphatase (non-canonical NTP hydrolase)